MLSVNTSRVEGLRGSRARPSKEGVDNLSLKNRLLRIMTEDGGEQVLASYLGLVPFASDRASSVSGKR